jgi:hypothetical protein
MIPRSRIRYWDSFNCYWLVTTVSTGWCIELLKLPATTSIPEHFKYYGSTGTGGVSVAESGPAHHRAGAAIGHENRKRAWMFSGNPSMPNISTGFRRHLYACHGTVSQHTAHGQMMDQRVFLLHLSSWLQYLLPCTMYVNQPNIQDRGCPRP